MFASTLILRKKCYYFQIYAVIFVILCYTISIELYRGPDYV